MRLALSFAIVVSLISGAYALSRDEQHLLDQYAAAIKHIESSNRYDIRVKSGTGKDGKTIYALGAYQIMDFNLPSWSKEAIGREVKEDEFLACKEIQDEIFRFHFGRYVKKYGPGWAAKAWLAGPVYVESRLDDIKQGRKKRKQPQDRFGTTPDEYAAKFFEALKALLP